MTIYIDNDYKCYVSAAEGRREIEASFFDGKCPELIESYRLVPAGEIWTREDGEVFTGEVLAAWKDLNEANEAQAAYLESLLAVSQAQAADMRSALNVLGVQSSIAAQSLRVAMDTAGAALTDAQALTCKLLYRQWVKLIGTTATPGQRFLHGDTLFKVHADASKHTFSREWEPGVTTASLYEAIDEEHSGTLDDPIPFTQPMEIYNGKYYSQNGKTYLCTRDSGKPLAFDLADLVGLYVTEVTSDA